MNKQQLAQKIWASANQMRSKIEASEYKDFILGFIFSNICLIRRSNSSRQMITMMNCSRLYPKTMKKPSSGFSRISAISLLTAICLQLGWGWVKTLMCPMCVMPFLPSTV